MPSPARKHRRTVAIALAMLFSAVPSIGMAQTADDAARAGELFKEGEAAMQRRDFDAACAKFDGAWKLSAQGGPLKRLADCEEARGHAARALELYGRLGGFATDDASKKTIALATERLQGEVGRIAIARKQGASGLDVAIDGTAVDAASASVVVDPGSHEVRLSGNGPAQTKQVSVSKGATVTVAIPFAAVADSSTVPPPGGSDATHAKSGLGVVRSIGIVAVSVGAAAAVGAAVTGGLILDYQGKADDACSNPAKHKGCLPPAFEAADSGKALLIPNAILFVTAVVGVGAGLPMIILGGNDDEGPAPTARLSILPSGLTLSGTY